jgi:hypothetical protein
MLVMSVMVVERWGGAEAVVVDLVARTETRRGG